jgi:hypothetical protein
MKATVFAALIFLPVLLAGAQTAAVHGTEDSAGVSAIPHVSFAFERAGFEIPRFTLDIDAKGRGTYVGEQAMQSARGVSSDAATQPFSRDFSISAATAAKIFTLARQADHFNITCASKVKNIAETGAKTLRYAGADGAGSCTFNYSEDKPVVELMEILRGTIETMDKGRELDRLRRYDRLGLDDAMASLTAEVADGSAREVGTIAPTLRAIAADPEVLQRVRTRAAALLNLIPVDAVTP